MPKNRESADAESQTSAVAEELLSPENHAKATKNVVLVRVPVAFKGQRQNRVQFSASHAAAAVMHGWGRYDLNNNPEAWGHLHHAGEPLKLTRQDYLAALKAAESGDVPHAAAVSPYKPKGSV